MDNLTHSLIGLAASKAGLERLSPGTTALCVLAANAPDADIIAAVGGRWAYLHHHRGITHSVAGTLALGIALPLVFFLVDLLIARIKKRKPLIKLRGLLLASLIVSATHPFMDWTNNYGVRFLLPWNSRWFYGDFAFVIDPVFWLVLGGSVFLLTSESKKQRIVWLIIAAIPTYLVFFGPADRGGLDSAAIIRVIWIVALVSLIVLFYKQAGKRWGARIPLAGFSFLVLYLGSLFVVHEVAVRRAHGEAASIAGQNNESLIEVAAMPTLANPLHWQSVVETERAAYKFNLRLTTAGWRTSNMIRHERVGGSSPPAVANASRDSRAQIFLNFARFPVARVVGEDCATQTIVQFADLRYTEPGRSRGTFTLDLPVECPVVGREQ
ncbi:MAG TPA: metal-dependent hydrolase, partial [Pyrinomonadaceae bacterium]|nr:metal-dependent hydrolase [Pyrinomonadaceae bacterium]